MLGIKKVAVRQAESTADLCVSDDVLALGLWMTNLKKFNESCRERSEANNEHS